MRDDSLGRGLSPTRKKLDGLLTYQAFLATIHTIAFCDQDSVEWHGGIEEYGFWGIGIDDPVWITAFESARVHLSPFLYPGYQRAPHITIVPCGLLDSSHFSETRRQRQLASLTEARMETFSLHVGPLDSFASTPYISVIDPTGALDIIRELLQQTIREDNLGKYVPYLTLRHYRDTFETVVVADHLKKITMNPTKPLVVKELLFCAYKTKESQGPFEILERVKLSD